MTPLNHQA
jgi:hypothetical protein